jgi:hypothetical protein
MRAERLAELVLACVLFDLAATVAMRAWPAEATGIRLAACAVTACFVSLTLPAGR